MGKNNKEAAFHVHLIDTEGKDLTCTVKTTTLKLTREMRKRERRVEKVRAVYTELTQAENKNDALISVIKNKLAQDQVENKAELEAELAVLEKEQEQILEEKDQNDIDVYDALIEQADLVLNYPNKEGVTADPQRTKDDIDWEASDLQEIRGAKDFFFEASGSSSFATKS